MAVPELDQHRRLAGILAADAAGFSRLMALDEAATVTALDAARAAFREAVEAHRGRVVDMAGDSVLAVFDTASAAIAAALAAQQVIESRATGDRPDRRLHFRVGVHLGELIEKADGSVYGDGVNIAARLQTLATPGGVAVSEAVRGAVGGRAGVGFEDMGAQAVKNIAEPVHVYGLRQAANVESPQAPGRRWRWSAGRLRQRPFAVTAVIGAVLALVLAAGALGTWRWRTQASAQASFWPITVAVLPFVADGGATDSAWADALTQSTTTALSQWKWVSVTAPGRVQAYRGRVIDAKQVGRELDVRYLVEADIRALGDKVGVTVRLVETRGGTQIWARDFETGSPPTAQQKALMAKRLAHRARNAISALAFEREAGQASAHPVAVQMALASSAWSNDENAGWRAARVHYDKALQIDPTFMPALVQRAWTLERECNSADVRDTAALAAFEAATARAIAVVPLDDEAWMARAVALSYLFRWGEAFAAIERAITLAPYKPNYIAMQANLHSGVGRQAEAEAGYLQAIAVDPPGDPFMLRSLCAPRLLMGRHDEAAPDCERAAARVRWYEDQMLLTAIYAHQGDAARTALASAELLKQRPGLTIENNFYRRLSDAPLFLQQVREHLESGLRKAGIPER